MKQKNQTIPERGGAAPELASRQAPGTEDRRGAGAETAAKAERDGGRIQAYTPEGVRRLESGARRALILAAAAGTAALIGCVLLCTGLTTAVADQRRMQAILLSTLGSFAAVCLIEGGMLPKKREAAHEAGVLAEEPETWEGAVTLIAPAHQIPKSVAFHSVTLRSGEEEVPLKLNARFRKDFPPEGARVRLEARRGYITAWETE